MKITINLLPFLCAINVLIALGFFFTTQGTSHDLTGAFGWFVAFMNTLSRSYE